MTGPVVPVTLQMSMTETFANPYSANIRDAARRIFSAVSWVSSACIVHETVAPYLMVERGQNFDFSVREARMTSSGRYL